MYLLALSTTNPHGWRAEKNFPVPQEFLWYHAPNIEVNFKIKLNFSTGG